MRESVSSRMECFIAHEGAEEVRGKMQLSKRPYAANAVRD